MHKTQINKFKTDEDEIGSLCYLLSCLSINIAQRETTEATFALSDLYHTYFLVLRSRLT